jgi:hypothetical protein
MYRAFQITPLLESPMVRVDSKRWETLVNIYVADLTVDGKVVLPKFITITAYEWGDDILFEATPTPGEDELYNIEGVRLVLYRYYDFSGLTVGNGHFLRVFKNSFDGERDLFTSKGKLVLANECGDRFEALKHTSDSKYGEVFLAYTKVDNKKVVGLFTEEGECIIPAKYKSIELRKDEDENIVAFEVRNNNDYIGIMDRDKNWIVPLSKQFTKVTPSEISGKKYFLCMKKGYWGLYDSNFNEVIAPDYEGMEVLDDTNFIKFRLNGFWGVMTLQTSTNTTKQSFRQSAATPVLADISKAKNYLHTQ